MWNALIKLVEKWACHHKWEFHFERSVTNDLGGTWHRRTYICERCGKFKQKKV